MKGFVRRAGMILLTAAAAVSMAWAGAQPEEPEGGGESGLEAPMLAEMVANGEIEPLGDRLPDEPATLHMLGAPGVYGGTMYTFVTGPDPWQDMMPAPEMSPRFLQMDTDGNIGASILSDWDISSDYTVGTFTLREGMRWSDGEPVKMEDVRIVYEVMQNTEGLTWWNLDYPRKGYEVDFEALDEWTFRLTLNKPKPRWEEELAGNAGNEIMNIQPSHWLGRWHPDYNSNAEAEAEDAGFDDWNAAFNDHYNPYGITEMKPTLHPWYVAEATSDQRVLVRNPYFYGVDPQGRQLPYIDRIIAQIVDSETYNLNVVSGESDVAYLYASFEDFTLFKQNEDDGDYRVVTIPGLLASNLAVMLNHTNDDPVKRELYRDIRFKQAVSVSINRDEINDILYRGQGVTGQPTAKPSETWYRSEWLDVYAQYDPGLANRLLDEVGMADRGSNGFRLGPDGNSFQIILMVTDGVAIEGPELIKEYFEEVGLRTEIRNVGGDLYTEAVDAGTYDITIGDIGYLQEYEGFAVGADEAFSWVARDWYNWFVARDQVESGEVSLDDFEGRQLPGEEPPQWVQEHEEAYRRARQLSPESSEYADLMTQIFDNQAAYLMLIGTVGQVPDLFIAKNYVNNVPTDYNRRHIWFGELGEYAYQFYIDE